MPKIVSGYPVSRSLAMLFFPAICVVLSPSVALSQVTISTFAGNGATMYAGDGGMANVAALNHPRGIAVGATGQLYIADVDNFRVRAVTPAGVIFTVAGTGVLGAAGDGGSALAATFSDINGLTVDSAGNLYVADSGNRRIRKVTPAGTVTTVAGTGIQGFSGDGGLATDATLNRPSSVIVDPSGNIYFSDSSNQRIRRVAPDGTITTIAGNGLEGFSGDGSLATGATMSFPLGLARDQVGNLYFTDGNNNRVRRITPSGIISTVAGDGKGRFAGDGGLATLASLNIPSDLAIDFAGNLYIADAGNNRVRRVDLSGIITTVAGTGADGFSGDGGVATSAMLNFPWAVTVDTSGSVYVADRVNSRIRRISGPPLGVPGLPQGAAVNSASFAKNLAIAPGSIVTIFGSDFSTAAASAWAIPLPAVIGETSVTFNGIAAPLYYVSAGQINAQVPFELGAGLASLQVVRGGTKSPAITVTVASVSPGIFIVDQATSQGAIVHADYSLVSGTNPARTGESLAIFCTGLGAVKIPVGSGAPSPASQLAETQLVPAVTLGGLTAPVSFSGLTPGLVGLYQVNVSVPGGLQPGNVALQIVAGGVSSNTATVAVSR